MTVPDWPRAAMPEASRYLWCLHSCKLTGNGCQESSWVDQNAWRPSRYEIPELFCCMHTMYYQPPHHPTTTSLGLTLWCSFSISLLKSISTATWQRGGSDRSVSMAYSKGTNCWVHFWETRLEGMVRRREEGGGGGSLVGTNSGASLNC